jgi:hypothetical protein
VENIQGTFPSFNILIYYSCKPHFEGKTRNFVTFALNFLLLLLYFGAAIERRKKKKTFNEQGIFVFTVSMRWKNKERQIDNGSRFSFSE